MIKTGLMSFGMSGKVFHAPFIFAHPLFELSAVCERHTKEASRTYPNIQSYQSIESLLNDPSLDLIVVNTPNNTHFEYAMKALEAKKHILVEKPFTITRLEAETLFAEAEKQQKKVFVFQNRRFDRDFASVQNVIEQHKLGKIHEAHLRFDRFKEGIGPKKFKEEDVPGAGIIYDLGPHLIDQAIALFGTPQSWTCHKSYLRKNTKVPDFAAIHLQYEAPLQVFITLSMRTMQAPAAYQFHGSEGSLLKFRSDVQEAQLILGKSPLDPHFAIETEHHFATLTARHAALIENIEVKVPSPDCSYMNFFNALADSILHQKPFPITQEEILTQISILEDIG